MMWLAHLAHVQGRLFLDDGAVRAVRDNHTSLLPAGISSVEGTFEAGDAVEMVSGDGTVIARGLVNYAAAELPQMLGRSTVELGESLGRGFDREVVHVDDLVLV
jgi:glutamate 5-kinase